MTTRSATHFLLEALCDNGVDVIFANFGTDHTPIIEELARWEREGRQAPRVILCGHENLAMHMAMGYAMVTGRGQAVMVHVDVGTANAAMGMHNMLRSRVPVLLISGKAPFTQHGELPGSCDTPVNIVQEPFDMASLVRPYAKWTYDLPSGIVVKQAIGRAFALMHSDPPGPAYLCAAREVLMEEVEETALRGPSPARTPPVQAQGLDPDALAQVTALLLNARRPVMVTAYAGRHEQAPALIDQLARLTGMAVVEASAVHLNIPRSSPCAAGFLAQEPLKDADLVLVVDCDVPWLPIQTHIAPSVPCVVIDADPLKEAMPRWDFPADMRIKASSVVALRQVLAAVEAQADSAYRAQAGARVEAFAARKAARPALPAAQGPLTVAHVATALHAAMAPDDILVHEAVTNLVPLLAAMPRETPLTVLGNGGGGLGIGGIALGAKLARPDRLVVHVTGDGSFLLGNPTAQMLASATYGLPVLTLVLDNRGWNAVKSATLRSYPTGEAKQAQSFQAKLGSDIRYDTVAALVGGHGETVSEAEALGPALERCLAAVKAGQPAVLVARIASI